METIEQKLDENKTTETVPAANWRDKINPPHYQTGRLQAIDVIDQFGLGFSVGNAVKYLLRAGKKEGESESDDLQKARWYIDHRLMQLRKLS